MILNNSKTQIIRKSLFQSFTAFLLYTFLCGSIYAQQATGPALFSAQTNSNPPAATSSRIQRSVKNRPQKHAKKSSVKETDYAAYRRPLSQVLSVKGDVTFDDTPLREALFAIRRVWKINISLGKIEGNVDGVFRNATLQEILDAILISNGYSYRVVGNTLVVKLAKSFEGINPTNFISEAISVRGIAISEVVESVKLLSSPRGQVKALSSAKSILVLDTPEKIALIRKLVRSLEKSAVGSESDPTNPHSGRLYVAYFHTQFIPASSAKIAIETVLSPDGTASALELEDQLIVKDYYENIEMARRVIQRVDRPRPQVRITALIYDIGVQDAENLGLNWKHSLKGSLDASGAASKIFSLNSLMKVPFAAGAPGAAMTFSSLSRHFDVTAVVSALQTAQDARLLGNPNVVVMDNETATFESVSEIPFQQLTQTAAGGSIGTTNFKKAGITLTVRPKIARDGTIELMINPEFSRLTGFTPGSNQPIIDTRRTSTKLRVANGETIVIGGLRQRSDTGKFNGVPFLKDLKYIGPLFRSRGTDVRESELIVFIFPEIVGYGTPLSPREQLANKTINCRLDAVPAADGCQQCKNCVNGLPCIESLPDYLPAESYPAPVTRGPTPTPATLPTPATAPLGQLYRLPPINSNKNQISPDSDPISSKKIPESFSKSISNHLEEKLLHPVALRPKYEARFRADPLKIPSQKTATNPLPKKSAAVPTSDPKETAKAKPFWKKLLPF